MRHSIYSVLFFALSLSACGPQVTKESSSTNTSESAETVEETAAPNAPQSDADSAISTRIGACFFVTHRFSEKLEKSSGTIVDRDIDETYECNPVDTVRALVDRLKQSKFVDDLSGEPLDDGVAVHFSLLDPISQTSSVINFKISDAPDDHGISSVKITDVQGLTSLGETSMDTLKKLLPNTLDHTTSISGKYYDFDGSELDEGRFISRLNGGD